MKVLKFLILLLISAKSFAQYTPIHTPTIWDMGGFKALFIGDTTFKPTDNTKNWIAIQGTTLYKWNSGAWVAISGGSGGDVTPYVLLQATPTVLGGIKYNTDFYIDANGRLAIDTSKKNLWNQVALLPYYSTTAQMRGEIRDTANAHNLTFGSAFLRTGNNIDLIQQPFVEKDSIFTNSPAASLTAGNMSDINAITDTSIHPTTTYVRSLLGKKDTVLFNRAHFYKKSDSTVNLNIKSINGIKLYGDTSNIVITGGGTAKLPYNGDSSFYFGGDTVLHRLPVAPATSDSIDYAFTAMTTVYNEAGPGEYVSSAHGLTANKDNFNFPFRQLKALDIGTWTDGDYVSFNNATIASSTNFTFLRAFIRLKSVVPVSGTISFAFYYNGTQVSKTISCVNYGIDKSKVGVYQNVSIPFSAFGFTGNNFDELRLKFGGTQSDGIYMDLVQFQNASVFENTFITDLFKKPLTDSVFKVVGGINVYAFRDSAGGSGGNGTYYSVSSLPDSTGFILNKLSGAKDTVLFNTSSGEVITAPNAVKRYWNGYKVFAPLNTDSVTEATNKYYTDTRARAAITLTTTGSGAATYNNTTGALNIPQSAGVSSVGTISWLGTSYDINAGNNITLTTPTTSNIAEGSNLYYTNTRARAAISVTGSGTYDNTTGVINITGGGGASQWTTVNTNDIYYNTGNVGIGSTSAPTAKLTVNVDNIGGQPVSNIPSNQLLGLALENNTAATSTANQSSPFLRFKGSGWKTNATAASQTIDVRNYMATTSGATQPSASVVWDISTNGGAYSSIMNLSSGGFLTVPAAQVNGSLGVTSINASGILGVVKISGAASGLGLFMQAGANGTASVPVQYSPAIRLDTRAWDGTTNEYGYWNMEARPISGTAPVKHNLWFTSSIATSQTYTPIDRFAISSTGGVILTPMTKVARDAIPTPEQGRVVFVSDNGGYLSYYNAGWFKVSAVAD